MLNNLTKEKFYQILNEEITNLFNENILNATTKLNEYKSQLSPEDLQFSDTVISNSLMGKTPPFTYEFYDKNKLAFNYICDSLVYYAKQEDESKKRNAINALANIFNLFKKETNSDSKESKMSLFFHRMISMSKNSVLRSKDDKTFSNQYDPNVDLYTENFYESLLKAIELFNFTNPFNFFFSNILKNKTTDNWRQQFYQKDKGKIKKHFSYEDKINPNDEESDTLLNKISSDFEDQNDTDHKHNQNYNSKFVSAFMNAMSTVLSKYPNILDYFNMYTIQNLEPKDIANKLGISHGTLRTKKNRWETENMPKLIPSIENLMSKEMGEEIKLPLPDGAFRFPRLKPEDKKVINRNYLLPELYNNKLIVKCDQTNKYLDFNIQHDDDDYLDLFTEIAQNRISKIQNIYNQFNEITSLLNEGGYDGNYNIDAMDLFDQIKGFVEESSKIINSLYDELHKIDDVAFNIRQDYPQIANTIHEKISPITEKLEEWPNNLSGMLKIIRMQYNPTRAYGI